MCSTDVENHEVDVETHDDGTATAWCSGGWSEVCHDTEVARIVAGIHLRAFDDAKARFDRYAVTD